MKKFAIVAGAGVVGCLMVVAQLAFYAVCVYGIVRLVRYAWGS